MIDLSRRMSAIGEPYYLSVKWSDRHLFFVCHSTGYGRKAVHPHFFSGRDHHEGFRQLSHCCPGHHLARDSRWKATIWVLYARAGEGAEGMGEAYVPGEQISVFPMFWLMRCKTFGMITVLMFLFLSIYFGEPIIPDSSFG